MSIHDLTPERLKELFSYDPDTGDFTWLKRQNPRATQITIGSKAGRISDQGYVRIYIGRNNHLAHRLAWMYVHGVTPKIIDHINGNRADNRIANLRLATRALNNQNRTKSRKRKYPLGVTPTKTGNFAARIYVTLAGRQVSLYLGTYLTEQEACEIYNAAKDLLHPGAVLFRSKQVSQCLNVADVSLSFCSQL